MREESKYQSLHIERTIRKDRFETRGAGEELKYQSLCVKRTARKDQSESRGQRKSQNINNHVKQTLRKDGRVKISILPHGSNNQKRRKSQLSILPHGTNNQKRRKSQNISPSTWNEQSEKTSVNRGGQGQSRKIHHSTLHA